MPAGGCYLLAVCWLECLLEMAPFGIRFVWQSCHWNEPLIVQVQAVQSLLDSQIDSRPTPSYRISSGFFLGFQPKSSGTAIYRVCKWSHTNYIDFLWIDFAKKKQFIWTFLTPLFRAALWCPRECESLFGRSALKFNMFWHLLASLSYLQAFHRNAWSQKRIKRFSRWSLQEDSSYHELSSICSNCFSALESIGNCSTPSHENPLWRDLCWESQIKSAFIERLFRTPLSSFLKRVASLFWQLERVWRCLDGMLFWFRSSEDGFESSFWWNFLTEIVLNVHCNFHENHRKMIARAWTFACIQFTGKLESVWWLLMELSAKKLLFQWKVSTKRCGCQFV